MRFVARRWRRMYVVSGLQMAQMYVGSKLNGNPPRGVSVGHPCCLLSVCQLLAASAWRNCLLSAMDYRLAVVSFRLQVVGHLSSKSNGNPPRGVSVGHPCCLLSVCQLLATSAWRNCRLSEQATICGLSATGCLLSSTGCGRFSEAAFVIAPLFCHCERSKAIRKYPPHRIVSLVSLARNDGRDYSASPTL
jgi:hypothetical protein